MIWFILPLTFAKAPFVPDKFKHGFPGPPQAVLFTPEGDTYIASQGGSWTVVTQVTVAGLGQPKLYVKLIVWFPIVAGEVQAKVVAEPFDREVGVPPVAVQL